MGEASERGSEQATERERERKREKERERERERETHTQRERERERERDRDRGVVSGFDLSGEDHGKVLAAQTRGAPSKVRAISMLARVQLLLIVTAL